jgi:hypothetical protein
LKRRVVIEDETVEAIADAVFSLTAQVENIANELRRHQHFALEGEDGGGKWTAQNDSYRFLPFEAVLNDLAGIKEAVKDLLPDATAR